MEILQAFYMIDSRDYSYVINIRVYNSIATKVSFLHDTPAETSLLMQDSLLFFLRALTVRNLSRTVKKLSGFRK